MADARAYATVCRCENNASLSRLVFNHLLFHDMTVETARAYYAYELMDAAAPLEK